MARAVTLLGEVASRTDMIEVRCGRCDRVGRLRTARLFAKHGPNAAIGGVMCAQLGACPKRDAAQIQDRCDPYCPDLERLFRAPELG